GADVVGEIESLCPRVPTEPPRLAHPGGGHLGAAAIEIDPPYLSIGLRRLANIARRADVYVKLAVRPQGHEFPAMRLMVEKVAVDDHGLGRIVQVIFDFFQLANFGPLAHAERTLVKANT